MFEMQAAASWEWLHFAYPRIPAFWSQTAADYIESLLLHHNL